MPKEKHELLVKGRLGQLSLVPVKKTKEEKYRRESDNRLHEMIKLCFVNVKLN